MVMPATVTGSPAAATVEARDVVALVALLRRAAEDQVLDLGALDPRARERLGDAMRREHRRIGVVEGAAIRLADRRAGDGDDDGFTHGAGPRVRGV